MYCCFSYNNGLDWGKDGKLYYYYKCSLFLPDFPNLLLLLLLFESMDRLDLDKGFEMFDMLLLLPIFNVLFCNVLLLLLLLLLFLILLSFIDIFGLDEFIFMTLFDDEVDVFLLILVLI